MIEVTIRASFGDIPAMAGFFTRLAHLGVVPDSIETEGTEPQGSITQPLFRAQQPAVAPQVQPETARRGRRPKNATAAILDQPQAQPAAGPFGSGAPAAQPQPAAPAPAAGPFGAPAAAAMVPTLDMLQVKISELIGAGKFESIVPLYAKHGVKSVVEIPETLRAVIYAELQAL